MLLDDYWVIVNKTTYLNNFEPLLNVYLYFILLLI